MNSSFARKGLEMPLETTQCLNCGKAPTRRIPSANADYAAVRVFCDTKCAAEYGIRSAIEKHQAGEPLKREVDRSEQLAEKDRREREEHRQRNEPRDRLREDDDIHRERLKGDDGMGDEDRDSDPRRVDDGDPVG